MRLSPSLMTTTEDEGPDYTASIYGSLLVTTLIGALGGHWVDERLGLTFPVFMLIGFFLGAGAGTVMIIRLVSRFLKSFD